MTHREEIKALFENFTIALEDFEPERIRQYTTEDVCAKISYAGEAQRQDGVVELLRWKGMQMNVSRRWIMTFALRISGNKAVQYSYLLNMMGVDDGAFLFPFEYGGRVSCIYENTKNGWKIKEIKFDLDWVFGNTYFAKDWKLIDYRMWHGHAPLICTEYEAPWNALPETEEEMSEIEQIKEALCQYSVACDNQDYITMKQGLTDDFHWYSGTNKKNAELICPDLRSFILLNKSVAHKEPTLEHPIKVVDISVKGDEAELLGYMVQPHRLRTKVLNKETINHHFYTAVYHGKLRKVDGKWKLYEVYYLEPRVFFEKCYDRVHYLDKI